MNGRLTANIDLNQNPYSTDVIELAFASTTAVSGPIECGHSNGTAMLEPRIID